ncbi:MAG: hypothetical protein EBQ89_06785 [Alphaproteobacteria bacterium]|jgi:hypothetical protein|nr:hypothetical protein [Alphaproteobacteria bacterium]
MGSAIDERGYLTFAQNDSMIRRLSDLGIEWDEQDIRISDIDLADNQYQTRLNTGSVNEEYAIRYKDDYLHGALLPMPLVVVPYSCRNQSGFKHSPCAGRHRIEGARRAGAVMFRTLRAHVKNQGDVDALRDVSMFDNRANGLSVSEDDFYTYCASEVVSKHGGLAAGMPDKKFIAAMFRRWERESIRRERLVLHIKSMMAKLTCNSLGLSTPANLVESYSELWSWSSDDGFCDLAKQFCRFCDDPDVRKVLRESKRKRLSASATLAELVSASRGYRGGRREPMDPAAVIRFRCGDIRKALAKLDSDMGLDFSKLDDVQRQIEAIWTESEETVAKLRAKIGGFVHA